MEPGLVLITGASGFVGGQLCPLLRMTGYKVRGTYFRRIPPPNSAAEMDWIHIPSIGANTDWAECLADGVTHVVHLAAVAHRIATDTEVPDSVYDAVNNLGTAQLAKAVARTPSVRRFLFVSSIGAICNISEATVDESTPCCPSTAYGKSKLAAEESVRSALNNTPVEWCILRCPLLYGPDNPGNMKRLLRLMELGVPLPLGSVNNRRSLLYVGNLIDAIRIALEHPNVARNLYCLSDGIDISTTDLLRKLSEAAERGSLLFPFPKLGLRVLGKISDIIGRAAGQSLPTNSKAIEKLCGSLTVNGTRFRRDCAWRPPFTIDQGLRATVIEPR